MFIKSIKEVKNHFQNNKDDLLRLRELYISLYSKEQIDNMSDKAFLDWIFIEYSFYTVRGYIEIKPSLVRHFERVIYLHNKPHILIYLYDNYDSHLDLFSLSMENRVKHFTSEADALAVVSSFGSVVSSFSGFVKKGPNKKLHKESRFLKTVSNFYGNYRIDGVQCCKMILMQHSSNLDLWSITLTGNDDFSISKDFLSKADVFKERDYLMSLSYVDRDALEHYYSL